MHLMQLMTVGKVAYGLILCCVALMAGCNGINGHTLVLREEDSLSFLLDKKEFSKQEDERNLHSKPSPDLSSAMKAAMKVQGVITDIDEPWRKKPSVEQKMEVSVRLRRSVAMAGTTYHNALLVYEYNPAHRLTVGDGLTFWIRDNGQLLNWAHDSQKRWIPESQSAEDAP
mgnify:CR=1 FL=1